MAPSSEWALYIPAAPMKLFGHARSWWIRVAVLTSVITSGSLVLVASCSSSSHSGVSIDAGDAAQRNDGPAAQAARACPPAPHANRCLGDDSSFVFVPPLACDLSAQSEGGVSDDGPSGEGADAGDHAMATPIAASGDGASTDGDAPPGACDGVTTLDVFFSPAACRAFVAAEASGDAAGGDDPSAPVIDEPADGDMLTPDNWSIFVWHPPVSQDSKLEPRFERALDLIERQAYASSPLGGDAYVLEFSQGCNEVLRVMLTGTFWLPDPASWALLTSLGGPVTVRVWSMHFASDSLVSGPLQSAPITITMQSHADD